MRRILIPILALLAVVMLLGVAQANPLFNTTQPVAGFSTSRWAFMTAWNLATGVQSVSPSWYNGRSVWSHPVTA